MYRARVHLHLHIFLILTIIRSVMGERHGPTFNRPAVFSFPYINWGQVELSNSSSLSLSF